MLMAQYLQGQLNRMKVHHMKGLRVDLLEKILRNDPAMEPA